MSCISLIVAMDENGLIGRDNDLPWRLPNDLRHFKQTTMGKPILMGRKSFDSIGRALPGRRNVVLTRDAEWSAPEAETASSLDAALTMLSDLDEIMIIGGAQIYAQALEYASRIYLTRVHARFAGDTYFPDIDWAGWKELSREDCPADERNPWPHSFVVLERT